MSDATSPVESARPQVVVVGPDGMAIGTSQGEPGDGPGDRPVTGWWSNAAKVMRIGSMIRQLLDEVKAAPLDEKSRARLKQIHQNSIKELEDGLAPELVEELERLSLPFEDATPSEAELRIAQAQLVGWRGPVPRHPDRCSPSRWRPGPSSSRCAGRCRLASCPPRRTPTSSRTWLWSWPLPDLFTADPAAAYGLP